MPKGDQLVRIPGIRNEKKTFINIQNPEENSLKSLCLFQSPVKMPFWPSKRDRNGCLIYSEEFEGFETLFRLFPPDPVQKKPVKISGNPVWVFLLQTGGFRKRESNFSERRVL